MFESAELGHVVDGRTYKRRVTALRSELLELQYTLLERSSFPVLILVNGVDGAGKGETVNLLSEWMDPRHIRSVAFGDETDEERARPPMWRFWQALPRKGKIGVLFGNWYTRPIIDRVRGETHAAELEEQVGAIVRFERMLADEGALLVKLWFHLSKRAQKKRLEALEADKATRWRVTREDWKSFASYDAYRKVSEHVLRETSTAEAPWVVIEGTDPNYRALTAGTVLKDGLSKRLADAAGTEPKPKRAAPLVPPVDNLHLLRTLPFKERLAKARYREALVEEQGRLNRLSRKIDGSHRSVVIVFEGNDAAGKGGAIRRITAALDARQVELTPIAAPTEEERAQPYLWRFWRNVPRWGKFAIFDRSWYGRVLVERVEGFAAESAWMRAYAEINDFEQELVAHGAVVVKFWLAVTKDEQLRRFEQREATRFKRFKITPDDWRNRKKWVAYEAAACDMIDRTSTDVAEWTLVEANDKHVARVRVLRTLSHAIEKAIG